MKTFKKLIYGLVLPVLFIAGCSEQVQKDSGIPDAHKVDTGEKNVENYIDIGIIESAGDLIIDINDGNDSYSAFRMLNDSDIYVEVKDIFDNADWETSEEKMSHSGEYRIESIDNEDKENPVSTIYYLSVNPEGNTVKLVDSNNELYTVLNESDSEKLFGILVDKNLSDYVIKKNSQ